MAGEKRERINTGTSKRFVKQRKSGEFREIDESGSPWQRTDAEKQKPK